jgi:hypothetical protein
MPQRADLRRATSSGGLRRNRIAAPTWADEIFGTGTVAENVGAAKFMTAGIMLPSCRMPRHSRATSSM